RVRVADVSVHEHVVRVAVQRRQSVQVAGIGEDVEVDDLDPLPHRVENEIAANKAGAAGHKPSGHSGTSCLLEKGIGTRRDQNGMSSSAKSSAKSFDLAGGASRRGADSRPAAGRAAGALRSPPPRNSLRPPPPPPPSLA